MYLLLAMQSGQLSVDLDKLWNNSNVLIKIGCAILIALTIGMWIKARIECSKLLKDIKSFSAELKGFHNQEGNDLRDGLSFERKDALFVLGERLNARAKEWWMRLAKQIEPYNGPNDQEGWFLTERGRNALSYEFVVGREFHSAWYATFPGILTGAGLTLTFLAILLGLLEVSMSNKDGIQTVVGIEPLINNLSSKFLSSIIALLLSIFFTWFVKMTMRRLQAAHEEMVHSIADTIPFLPMTRILLDIHSL